MDKEERFLIAIKENEGFIYKIATVYTNTADEKNDLVQEIIYQLWKSFDSYNQKSTLGTWIYRVALNVALFQLKQNRKKISTIPIHEQELNHTETGDAELEEQWKQLKHKIDNLNLLEKGIVMLYLDNKSYDEIADIMGMSKTNVGTRLARIKEKLKSQMDKHS